MLQRCRRTWRSRFATICCSKPEDTVRDRQEAAVSSTSDPIRVGRVVPHTSAEGPGVRFAIWVQGCSIRCHGCFNPHLWSTSGGVTMSVDQLTDAAIASGDEGITLLGGEPFEQAGPLGIIAQQVREAGLSVMTFTGYTLPRLRSRATSNQEIGRLLNATDLLVDGPYIASKPDHERPWVGSTNQQFHLLTDRYRALAENLPSETDRLEIRIAPDGLISVNGWAPTTTLEKLLAEDFDPIGTNSGRIHAQLATRTSSPGDSSISPRSSRPVSSE
ncbi:4Fe-4S single cluster domain-containing protein [Citricoccus sp. CH26A]|uniref:4Fe-4S single cluster domain-containing protein n=1 Tax=Citricoccus TaxID=169133 RepID=UPI0009FD2AB5|nr:4Fe-4S single cluster domain-containing protein [Citricoccus sp. CH26A]